MKKSTIATLLLACAISTMLLVLTNRYCSLFPLFGEGCQMHQQLGLTHETLMAHHGEMNTWHHRIEVEYEIASTLASSSDFENVSACEIEKTAAYALGSGEEEHALAHLESLALNGNCLEARKAAVHAIEGFGSDEARATLGRILWEVTD